MKLFVNKEKLSDEIKDCLFSHKGIFAHEKIINQQFGGYGGDVDYTLYEIVNRFLEDFKKVRREIKAAKFKYNEDRYFRSFILYIDLLELEINNIIELFPFN